MSDADSPSPPSVQERDETLRCASIRWDVEATIGLSESFELDRRERSRWEGELRFVLEAFEPTRAEVAAELLARYLLAQPTADHVSRLVLSAHVRVRERFDVRTRKSGDDSASADESEIFRTVNELTWVIEDKPHMQVDVIFEGEGAGLYRLRLKPGGHIATHVHRRTDEHELVLGTGLLCQGIAVEAGEATRWPREFPHRYDNPTGLEQTVLCVDRPAFMPDARASERITLTGGAGPLFRRSFDVNPLGTRRVLVTGGGSGIGRAVALALAGSGAQVVVAGRRRDLLERLAAAYPKRVIAIPCDLANAAERDSLLQRARDQMGGLDGLVYSAGIAVHQRLGEIDETSLRSQLEVNLVAPLRLAEGALKHLEEGGAAVFLASSLAHRPTITSAAYSASKAGLLAVVKVLAQAGAARSLRASALVPGVVQTEMTEQLRTRPGEPPPLPGEADAKLRAQLDALRQIHLLRRLGTPEEVARAAVFLLGASWITGSELVIDGGLLARE